MTDTPKTLFIDIETFPLVVNTWGLWQQNVINTLRWSTICACSWKWKDGKQTTKALPDYKGYKPGAVNDEKLVNELWELLDEADIVVAHNGDDFDIKKMNARFVKYGLTPPTPYKTVDTKKVAKRLFRFDSASLNNICSYLGIGKKMSTGGFELWEGCLAGDTKSWEKMKKYNAHDVRLLEEVYDRMLPWMNDHPNKGLWRPNSCPKCGSDRLQSRGLARTITRNYRRFQCMDCGGWSRSTQSESKTLVTSL